MFEMMMQNNSGLWVFLIFALMFVFFAVIIWTFVFWIWMIIDCAKRKGLSDSERIAWILVLVFLQVLGAAIYYFAVKRK
ncbi:MAG: PLDc N-terminal domain-containing protein [Candidatus Woesearchaeota archaeon]|nr:PLDc N-terminal domain-containing protein [Candidatus Woesearchaeota archaeon]